MTPPSSAPLSAPRRTVLFAGLVVALATAAFAPRLTRAGESAVKIAPPAVDATTSASVRRVYETRSRVAATTERRSSPHTAVSTSEPRSREEVGDRQTTTSQPCPARTSRFVKDHSPPST